MFGKIDLTGWIHLHINPSMSEDILSNDLSPLAGFETLAEETNDLCQTVNERIPSEWSDLALSGITTPGYQLNRKHSVENNITPLVEAGMILETFDN